MFVCMSLMALNTKCNKYISQKLHFVNAGTMRRVLLTLEKVTLTRKFGHIDKQRPKLTGIRQTRQGESNAKLIPNNQHRCSELRRIKLEYMSQEKNTPIPSLPEWKKTGNRSDCDWLCLTDLNPR